MTVEGGEEQKIDNKCGHLSLYGHIIIASNAVYGDVGS